MTPGENVWVERTKWPDRPHYGGPGILLGEDEHGRWVGEPPNHPVYRGEEILFIGEHAVVTLVPHDDWYLAHWYGRDEIYVDIATPAVWTDHRATAVDLDFDIWAQDGIVELLDADEFEVHRERYKYPDDIVAGARRAAAEIHGLVVAGHPPFVMAIGRHWHDLLVGRAMR